MLMYSKLDQETLVTQAGCARPTPAIFILHTPWFPKTVVTLSYMFAGPQSPGAALQMTQQIIILSQHNFLPYLYGYKTTEKWTLF